jgi:hypothetical protein
MIARNYRKYPEALALQLCLELVCVVVRKIRERHAPGAARQAIPAQFDAEDIPLGAIVQTPTGKKARVLGYRGYRRDHIVRLWLQYLDPENKRFDKVLLAPDKVTVIEEKEKA